MLDNLAHVFILNFIVSIHLCMCIGRVVCVTMMGCICTRVYMCLWSLEAPSSIVSTTLYLNF